MRRRDLEQLERRSGRTASALNFMGILASQDGLQALQQMVSPKRLHAECRRAVTLCTDMARHVSGTAVDPGTAKDHLDQVEGALVRDDVVSVRRHAAAALRALGFEAPPETTPHAPPRLRVPKGATPLQRRRRKRR
jgi:hypothetical protein